MERGAWTSGVWYAAPPVGARAVALLDDRIDARLAGDGGTDGDPSPGERLCAFACACAYFVCARVCACTFTCVCMCVFIYRQLICCVVFAPLTLTRAHSISTTSCYSSRTSHTTHSTLTPPLLTSPTYPGRHVHPCDGDWQRGGPGGARDAQPDVRSPWPP